MLVVAWPLGNFNPDAKKGNSVSMAGALYVNYSLPGLAHGLMFMVLNLALKPICSYFFYKLCFLCFSR